MILSIWFLKKICVSMNIEWYHYLTCQNKKCSLTIVLTASLDHTSLFKVWHWNSPASCIFTKSHFLEAVAASLADCQSPLNIISRGGLNNSSNVRFLPLDDAPLLSRRNVNANSDQGEIQTENAFKNLLDSLLKFRKPSKTLRTRLPRIRLFCLVIE